MSPGACIFVEVAKRGEERGPQTLGLEIGGTWVVDQGGRLC